MQDQAVSDEAITYAIQELSANSSFWTNALAGSFAGTDCNTGHDVNSPTGKYHYRIYCSTGTAGNSQLQIYQLVVTAVTMSTPGIGGVETPLRATKAYISQRTLGADLSSGYHVAAAVQLVRQPSIQGSLNVHWGPILCLNQDTVSTAWSLADQADTIDSQRYPRKFSLGGITGSAYSRSRHDHEFRTLDRPKGILGLQPANGNTIHQ